MGYDDLSQIADLGGESLTADQQLFALVFDVPAPAMALLRCRASNTCFSDNLNDNNFDGSTMI